MMRHLTAAALALLLAAPLAAQAPAGLEMRVDKSTSATDPDDVPDVSLMRMDGALHVITGPAATIWDPADTASGTYTLHGRFTLLEPSGHVNYYGLVFGGQDLEGPRQRYLYFMVAQNGTYMVKHRAGDETTHEIQGGTPHDAVVQPGANGQSVNDLEVRVGESQVDFVVNGTVVHSAARTGMLAGTDGNYGFRINHVIPGVLVDDLEVTR